MASQKTIIGRPNTTTIATTTTNPTTITRTKIMPMAERMTRVQSIHYEKT